MVVFAESLRVELRFLAHSADELTGSIFLDFKALEHKLQTSLLAQAFPHFVPLQECRNEDVLRLKSLEAPEFAEGLVVEEHDLGLLIEGYEPCLRVKSDAIVTFAMTEDTALLVSTNRRGFHDVGLVRHNSDGSVGDDTDSSLEEDDVVFVEVFDFAES